MFYLFDCQNTFDLILIYSLDHLYIVITQRTYVVSLNEFLDDIILICSEISMFKRSNILPMVCVIYPHIGMRVTYNVSKFKILVPPYAPQCADGVKGSQLLDAA